MVVLCGSILQERLSEWVQCPVNVSFAFDCVAKLSLRRPMNRDSVE